MARDFSGRSQQRRSWHAAESGDEDFGGGDDCVGSCGERAGAGAMAYGASVSLENAKKAAAPALAEAAKNGWMMAVAIVDTAGNLVYFEKMDNTQLGSVNVAQEKARSAALFKRPTQAFQERLATGGDALGVLRIQGAMPVAGGVPLVMDGKIVGAIGVSGATSAQDAQCAKAGADALK